MKNFGFIGFGSMSKMIINCMIKYANIHPNQIYVTRRDKNRLHEINDIFEDVITVNTLHDVMVNADIIFICVKPMEIKAILPEIASLVTDKTHIISLAGSVSISNIQSVLSCKITKYMWNYII